MEQIGLLNQRKKKERPHTHSHPNNYSFSGAVSRLFRGPAVTQSSLNYTVLVTFPTAQRPLELLKKQHENSPFTLQLLSGSPGCCHKMSNSSRNDLHITPAFILQANCFSQHVAKFPKVTYHISEWHTTKNMTIS